MNKEGIEAALDRMIEALASIEHERWSHWQRYVHGKGQLQADGSLLLPADLVERWERQIATPYTALSEDEKKSDREQVRRYLSMIAKGLASGTRP